MEQLSRIAIDLAFCPSNHSISGINDPGITFPSTVLTTPLDASAPITEIRCPR